MIKLPSTIPIELLNQLDQVVHKFQTKLLTRSCVPLSTGVAPLAVKAMKMTDELIDIYKVRDSLWPEKKQFLESHAILSYCLVWSFWGLKKRNPQLHKLALTLYGCSVYVLFFRKFFHYCDDQKFQMALQRTSVRSLYYNRTHMAVVEFIINNQIAKPTTSTDHLFRRYEVLVNTLRQSMRIVAHAYYEEPKTALEPKMDIATILRITESIWDFPNEVVSNAIIKRYVLRKPAFMCLQSFVRKNKTTLLRLLESALYKHTPTVTYMKSKSWLKKITIFIMQMPDFITIMKMAQQECGLINSKRYWISFLEYTHERLKTELSTIR